MTDSSASTIEYATMHELAAAHAASGSPDQAGLPYLSGGGKDAGLDTEDISFTDDAGTEHVYRVAGDGWAALKQYEKIAGNDKFFDDGL